MENNGLILLYQLPGTVVEELFLKTFGPVARPAYARSLCIPPITLPTAPKRLSINLRMLKSFR